MIINLKNHEQIYFLPNLMLIYEINFYRKFTLNNLTMNYPQSISIKY
jgi:hypothetical protein